MIIIIFNPFMNILTEDSITSPLLNFHVNYVENVWILWELKDVFIRLLSLLRANGLLLAVWTNLSQNIKGWLGWHAAIYQN